MKIKAKQFSLDSSVLPTHNAVDLGHEVNPMQVVYSNEFVGDLTGAVTFKAKNETGATLAKGKAVYVSGVSSGIPTVALADANDSSKMPAVGLTAESASNNAEVHIISFGDLSGLNTSSMGSVGASFFVSTTPGAITTTPPTGSSSKIQNIGQLIKQHSSQGTIRVVGASQTEETPNLDEGHFFLGNSSDQSVQSAYQLPTSIGTNNHVLTSNGTDVVFQAISSIASVSDADNDTKIQVEESSDEDKIRFDTAGSERMVITHEGKVGIGVATPSSMLDISGDLVVRGGDIHGNATGNPAISVNSTTTDVTVPNKLTVDGDGSSDGIKLSDGLIEMRTGTGNVAQIDMYCESTGNPHKVSLKAPPHSAFSGNIDFVLPATEGSNGQYLKTDGNGNTSWGTVSGGGGSSFSASDITGQSEHSHSLHNDDDFLIVYDGSASALKKISKGNFFKGYYTDTIPEFASLQVGDFTFDTSGGSTSQYLRLKMNSNENQNEPIFLIENQSSSTYGPILAIGIREDNSNAVGDNDTLGQIRFQETQSNGSLTRWGSISCKADDHTNGYGQLDFNVKSGTSEALALLVQTSSGGTTVDIRNHDGVDSGLKLGGQLVTSSAFELNKLDGATVNATELNLLDGHTSVGSSITIADTDGFIVNDNGTTKLIPASDLKSYAGGSGGGGANVSTSSPSSSDTLTYSSSNSEEFFIVTPSADVTLTLPTIGNNSIPNGYKLNIKNMSSSNTITVSPNSTGSNRIDGSSSISHSLSTQYESITFVCDGNVTWYRV